MKNAPPFTTAVIEVNPKIDSRTQRRLPCSLKFNDVFQYLAPDDAPRPQGRPALWGVEFPSAVASRPRTLFPKP